MSQQLQSILSALQQQRKPQAPQSAGGPRPQQASQQGPSIGLSNLSSLVQLIGKSVVRPPQAPSQALGSTSPVPCDASQSVSQAPQTGSTNLSAMLRPVATVGQPSSLPPSTAPMQIPSVRPHSSQAAGRLQQPTALTTWGPAATMSDTRLNGHSPASAARQQPLHGQTQQTIGHPTVSQLQHPKVSSGATQQQSPGGSYNSLASSPLIAAVGIVDSPLGHNSWQLEEKDVETLLSLFGQVEWMKLLCSPLGPGLVADCCVVKYRDSASCSQLENELDGCALEEFGKLAVSVFPASLLDGVADEASLAALVSSKTQAKASGPPPASSTWGGQSDSMSGEEASVVAVLASAIGVSSGDSGAVAALMNTAAGRNAVAAVRSNPSLLADLQSHLQSLSQPSQTPVPEDSALFNNRPKKRVCRLELVDLFGHHPDFDVTSLIVGQDNSNILYVLGEAKQRVDIELNGVPLNSAPVADRLHLTVTSLEEEAYNVAVETLEDLLQSICRQYAEFCSSRKLGPVPPGVGFRRHEYIESADGKLMYLGLKERPKPWLEDNRYH